MGINKDKTQLTESTELRRIAEERMCRRTSDEGFPPGEEATQRIVHELEVHQIELVMQNEELRQSRFEVEAALEKYTDLYEFAPVGYFTLDRDGSVSAVNLAAANLLRIERSLLIGRRFGLFLSPEYRHTFTAFLDRVFSGPGDETCEVVLHNNVSLPLTVQLGATASASGTECRLALIDITGRRQAEDALRESEQRMYRLAEMAADGIIMLDDSGNVTFCNAAAEKMFGDPAEQSSDGNQRRSSIPAQFLNAARQSLDNFRKLGTAPEIGTTSEVVARRKDGTEFSLELSTSALKVHEKWHAIVIMRDITERRLLENEIRNAREYAENIVETVREPLVVLNANLKILTANHSFYDTFKVTPEETIGNFIYDLGNRQWDIPKLRVLFEEILHYHAVFNDYEVEHDFQDIGRKIILLNARQIFRENIGSHIILLAMEDITERKQLEEDLQKAHDQLEEILKARTAELTQANAQQQELAESNRRLEDVSRTKSDFLANMSHELRTPLNSVIGFSEVLQDRMFGPINEKQQEYVTNILTSGRHLLSLINDILDLSKVESGKMVLELTGFSLRETIADSLTMLREKAQKQGITLTMNLTTQADITIMADQRKLKQILFNLLSNAVKFTPSGGTVGVTAEKDGFLVEIKVTDSGMGIRKEDLPKLFQAFTQLESVYTKEYEGTGLGLALTRQLVELHGGRIWVESDFGVGSTFSFTIPMAQSIP